MTSNRFAFLLTYQEEGKSKPTHRVFVSDDRNEAMEWLKNWSVEPLRRYDISTFSVTEVEVLDINQRGARP